MAASSFLPPAQSFRPNVSSQSTYPLSIAPPANAYDRDATTKPVGTPFSATPSATPLSSAVIHNLPAKTKEEELRLMLLFSKDLAGIEFLRADAEDSGTRSALVKFNSPAGAQDAKNALHGRSISPSIPEVVVEILGSSPSAMGVGKRYPIDTSVTNGASSATSSAASSATSSRQTSRFDGTFQSMTKMSPLMNGVYGGGELMGSEPGAHYQSIFSPQSPIGNHLTDRNRISGKSLINNDSADDDETRELLNDPVGFAENGLGRRQNASQVSLNNRLASLSLNTTPASGHAPIPHYGHPAMAAQMSSLPTPMPPTAMSTGPMGYGQQSAYRMPHAFPPANPADQNPPCNTLYVGNLPLDTSEEELKAMFSKQRGYKRLCFRTKQNGPMCFVEFEDVSFATKALNDLYGQPLHNSVKGGIRLSFSKNPLGVRSGPSSGQSAAGSMGGLNGMHPGSTNGFTTASGPPPGLTAPPGLGMNRSGHSASPNLASGGSNPYNSPAFSSSSSNTWGTMYGSSHNPMMAGSTSSFPPHMMGR